MVKKSVSSTGLGQPGWRTPVIQDANMPGHRDHWRELCIAAAFEENPERLTDLVEEINQYLMERQEQLTDQIFERLAANPATHAHSKHWIQ